MFSLLNVREKGFQTAMLIHIRYITGILSATQDSAIFYTHAYHLDVSFVCTLKLEVIVYLCWNTHPPYLPSKLKYYLLSCRHCIVKASKILLWLYNYSHVCIFVWRCNNNLILCYTMPTFCVCKFGGYKGIIHKSFEEHVCNVL